MMASPPPRKRSMRSARAMSTNGPAGPASTRRARRARRRSPRCPARRARLVRDEPAGDALEARPPEGADAGPLQRRAERLAADRDEPRLRIRRQRAGKRAHEAVERLVDDSCRARPRRDRRRADRARLQPQDVARVDRIGIAHPGLDLGDREPARPRRDRRARRRRARGRCAGAPRRAAPARRAARSRRRARSSSPPRVSTASSRSSQRDGTVGVPSTPRGARQHHLARAAAPARNHARRCRCGAPAAACRSCRRIGRDSHGSLAVSARPHALVEAAEHDAGRRAAAAPPAGPR